MGVQTTVLAKPAKPYPDFPLFPHATRRWAKKIRGKLHYFGPWDDPQAALAKYQEQRDDLHAGRVPRQSGEGLELKDMLNHFLSAKQRQVEAGELTTKTFSDYHTAASRLIEAFGKHRLVDDLTADDFGRFRAELAKTRGPVALGNSIQHVRTIFKYGYDAGLMDKPIRFGPEFVKPGRLAIRLAKAAKPKRLFTAAEIRAVLEEASIELRAMILLGINCGWGNHDVATVPLHAINLADGQVDFPRPKTGIERQAPLWPETVKAIRSAVAVRPTPKDQADADIVFITKYGRRWAQGKTDSVGLEFRKIMRRLNIKRDGVAFYSLRYTFRTVAENGVKDFPAIDRVMGHENGDDIHTHYRERIDDDRLRRVTDHVWGWLFNHASDGLTK